MNCLIESNNGQSNFAASHKIASEAQPCQAQICTHERTKEMKQPFCIIRRYLFLELDANVTINKIQILKGKAEIISRIIEAFLQP